jgi:hypothetical protein
VLQGLTSGLKVAQIAPGLQYRNTLTGAVQKGTKERKISSQNLTVAALSDPGKKAVEIVDRFLQLIMIPDVAQARGFVANDLKIVFTGGVSMKDPSECAAFNARRYAWVKKKFDRYEVIEGASEAQTIVYSLGTLYGAWPDNEPFEANRYVDRYVIEHGKIKEMHVWNDSAERILARLNGPSSGAST